MAARRRMAGAAFRGRRRAEAGGGGEGALAGAIGAGGVGRRGRAAAATAGGASGRRGATAARQQAPAGAVRRLEGADVGGGVLSDTHMGVQQATLPARGSGSGWRRASGTAASAAPPGDSGAAARARGAAGAATGADAGAPESPLGLWWGCGHPHIGSGAASRRAECPHGAGHFSGAQAERRVRSGHLVAVGVAHAAHIGRHRWCPCREQLWHHGRGGLLSSSRGGGGAAGVLEGRAERREHLRDLHRYVMHAWGTGVLRGLYLSSSICGRRRRRPRPP